MDEDRFASTKQQAALFGVRLGGRCKFRLQWPHHDERFFVVLKPPEDAKEEARAAGAGLALKRDGTAKMDPWDLFLGRAHNQVVDFCLPQYEYSWEPGPDGEEVEVPTLSDEVARYNTHNPRANESVYANLPDDGRQLLVDVMGILAGDEGPFDLYDRLKKEHGPLLKRIVPREN